MSDFSWNGKVYFADTDAAGVVHHSQYLRYLEAARIDCFDYLSYPYEKMQSEGIGFVPVSIQSFYKMPLRFSNCFSVDVIVKKIGKASIEIFQPLYFQGRCCFEATVKLACMDEKGWVIKPIPSPIKQVLLKLVSAS